jgi:import inner membrane translocase subunit TIM23
MSHGKQSELYTSDFGDQLAFTVGCSYMFGFLGGLAGGIVNGVPKSWRMPKKLIMNNFFNSVGKETSRIGNGFAAAGFMYVGVGIVLNAVF